MYRDLRQQQQQQQQQGVPFGLPLGLPPAPKMVLLGKPVSQEVASGPVMPPIKDPWLLQFESRLKACREGTISPVAKRNCIPGAITKGTNNASEAIAMTAERQGGQSSAGGQVCGSSTGIELMERERLRKRRQKARRRKRRAADRRLHAGQLESSRRAAEEAANAWMRAQAAADKVVTEKEKKERDVARQQRHDRRSDARARAVAARLLSVLVLRMRRAGTLGPDKKLKRRLEAEKYYGAAKHSSEEKASIRRAWDRWRTAAPSGSPSNAAFVVGRIAPSSQWLPYLDE